MRTLAFTSSTRRGNREGTVILLIIGTLFFAALSGAVVAFGSKVLILPILAIMGLAAVLAMPASWTLWLMFIALFVVLGPVVYFSHFTQLQWLPPLMGTIFLFHIVIHTMRDKSPRTARVLPGFIYLLITFLLLAIFATAIDVPELPELINASRFYLFMWPVMLVFMLGIVQPATIERVWKAVLAVTVLQLPVAAYQYFFVAKRSSRLSPWDAVVGTFPGNIEGGGQSAAMGLMLLVTMLLAIALWRKKKLHGLWATLVVSAGLVVLALAEVKAVVLLLPFVVAVYYRRELLKRPLESVLSMVLAGVLMAALFVGYQRLHYDETTHSTSNPNLPTTTTDRILRALSPDTESKDEHQIGRVTHLVLWWDFNVKQGDLQHSLFGYGIGATQTSNLGTGEIARRFPYPMDVSTSTILLWETGLLGHLLFIAILASGAWLSGRLANDMVVPELEQVFLRVGAVGLFLVALTLPYKDYAMHSIPIQFLVMLMLGQAGYWFRIAGSQARNGEGRCRNISVH